MPREALRPHRYTDRGKCLLCKRHTAIRLVRFTLDEWRAAGGLGDPLSKIFNICERCDNGIKRQADRERAKTG
jgi:hypothetical protein